VKIDYTTTDGSSWITITSSTANTGAYTWTVPNAVSSQCKVKISEASHGRPSDISNRTFAIIPTPDSLKVISPNGGERWAVGSSHSITWATTGTVKNVKIEYTTNNGSSWITIMPSTPNNGSYTWTVPNTVSSQCKTKISGAFNGKPSDTSNAVFSIIKA
jgi:hypothetical protein